ncbi:hypothetical protein CMUS01_16376 [Colletotrichum musicola]|uniref:Uncharacterized protein n=1 Tax=Colletotrichum musicola TaxID=2175873 RepID=A0A8H6MIE9_9PEZI|nr:hypothetical protein CMUS01_16376 [Colletotrichum musicola]
MANTAQPQQQRWLETYSIASQTCALG